MILLLGATGHLGQAFSAELRKRRRPFMPLTRSAVDYTRFEVLFSFVRNTKPAFIINAAGYHAWPDVDDCEVNRAETIQANTLLPQTVARVCCLTKTPWGHVSSGAIYTGAKVTRNSGESIEPSLDRTEIRELFAAHPEWFHGFTEADEPNFTFRSASSNFYSGTKALAEEALRWFEQAYLWRPGLVFDEFDQPHNHLARIQQTPRLADSVDSYTHRGEFVSACLDLWERHAAFGAYHIVNPGAVSARQLAGLIERVRQPARPFEFVPAGDPPDGKAPRSHCLLDSAKLHSLGVRLRPALEALEEALRRWQQPPPNQEWLSPSFKSPVVG